MKARLVNDGGKDLVFLPLGGAGEIGMNLSLYGFGRGLDRAWIMVDLGVSFGDAAPGADAAMPDATFAEELDDRLLGLVLTHAHEDHIGAVPHIWPRLRCPIYATRFTAALVERKLKEAGLGGEADMRLVEPGARIALPPFEFEYVQVTHSIPEANALAIRTPAGLVVHSGDWKLDPQPVLGPVTDDPSLRGLGEEGVHTLICDSTNVFEPGVSGSESEVREQLLQTIAKRRGRVAVTAFASNVSRLDSIFQAAAETGRSVCLAGRSMRRITEVARETGVLNTLPELLSEDEAAALPPERVLLACTGSQGEPRAALWRIATGQHPRLSMEPGDTVFFSSKAIPGNELEIGALQNALVGRGVEVVTEADEPIHVSGHPNRDELVQMYRWLKPRAVVPVHGELRHIREHAAFAKAQGVPESVEAYNGAIIRIAPGPLEIVDEAATGRLQLDGGKVVKGDDGAFNERSQLSSGGLVDVVIVIDSDGEIIAGPDVRLRGVPALDGGDRDALSDALADKVERAVLAMPSAQRFNEELVEQETKRALRRALSPRWDKRPMIDARAICLED